MVVEMVVVVVVDARMKGSENGEGAGSRDRHSVGRKKRERSNFSFRQLQWVRRESCHIYQFLNPSLNLNARKEKFKFWLVPVIPLYHRAKNQTSRRRPLVHLLSSLILIISLDLNIRPPGRMIDNMVQYADNALRRYLATTIRCMNDALCWRHTKAVYVINKYELNLTTSLMKNAKNNPSRRYGHDDGQY
jgi:hypothetical protein